MSDSVRYEAFLAVERIEGGAYSNLVFTSSRLTGKDLAFAERIALGTTERSITLGHIIDIYVQKKCDKRIEALLKTGIYQILYMTKVPDSAACDETTEIAKKLFGKQKAGFVNAILRNVVRNKDRILADIAKSVGRIKYSVGDGIYNLIKNDYPDEYDSIFEAFLENKRCFLRVNTVTTDAKSLAAEVGGNALSDKTVECSSARDALAAVKEGKCIIQGLGSQKAVELLDAKSGMTVVDVCACPGGKSLGAAMDMNNSGKIYSFDIHQNKLSLITKSAETLGISIISAEINDGRRPKSELFGKADRVICDVPCSGTGEMGSKPEIKYKDPAMFGRLYDTQREILKNSAKYLRAGGIMVYSTCSINKTENEKAVEHFLHSEDGKDYRLESQCTYLPTGFAAEGFYTARIIREK